MTGLDRRTHRHHFVRVNRLIWLLAASQLAHKLLDHRHAGRAANEHQFIQVLWGDLGVLQGSSKRRTAAFYEWLTELFKLGARYFYLQVLGAGSVCRDVRQVNFSF